MVAGTPLIAILPRKLEESLANPNQTRLVAAPKELGNFRYLMIWHSRQELDVRHLWLRQAIGDATRLQQSSDVTFSPSTHSL